MARERFDGLPVLVVARGQTQGRGRSGSGWETADRALAASLAFSHDDQETRPLSLMAGVAAVWATEGTSLKWPNDVIREGLKVGGILVERSGGLTVVGLGLNLWWASPPEAAGALFSEDPGERAHTEIGALWAAEMMELVESAGWPIEVYREMCDTLGLEITWEPDGRGRAVDIADDGALVVERTSGLESLHSGAIRHLRRA